MFRTALQDTEVGGVPIPQGCRVFDLDGAGSHDPDVFDRADELVGDRDWEQLQSRLGSGTASITASDPTSPAPSPRVAIATSYRRLFSAACGGT